ncbi:Bro-N domain-containing protein [Azomonas macrocytogenes]|uniref:Prophage antirepressor-like protein n=1 Tax=Azomonas macrocytogenes TaxID=69962 RepID=A0A839T752_AZOMA|nr:BRO family protein [Azomonas macrocytogenes]MBB3103785.1 prophage antirepressor-like protein [Azomonas macrocytogenes]
MSAVQKQLQPKKQSPGEVRVARALDNVKTNKEINVVNKNTIATAQIIPFEFDRKPLRATLIAGLPWFVAADVCAAINITNYRNAVEKLDEDEKGVHSIDTLGGTQQMLVVNESGLNAIILRCRDAMTRGTPAHRYRKWVTAEVLPAIRKHGRYEDASGKMGILLDDVIGTSGVNVLDRVIEQKASPIAASLQRSFKHTMKSRLRSRFNVQRTDLIPASQLADACNFIAAYALEGEWIGKEEKPGTFVLDEYQAQDLVSLLHYTDWVLYRWNQGISAGLKAINPKFHAKTWEFFQETQCAAKRLERGLPELIAHFHQKSHGYRPHEAIAKGIQVGHPAD